MAIKDPSFALAISPGYGATSWQPLTKIDDMLTPVYESPLQFVLPNHFGNQPPAPSDKPTSSASTTVSSSASSSSSSPSPGSVALSPPPSKEGRKKALLSAFLFSGAGAGKRASTGYPDPMGLGIRAAAGVPGPLDDAPGSPPGTASSAASSSGSASVLPGGAPEPGALAGSAAAEQSMTSDAFLGEERERVHSLDSDSTFVALSPPSPERPGETPTGDVDDDMSGHRSGRPLADPRAATPTPTMTAVCPLPGPFPASNYACRSPTFPGSGPVSPSFHRPTPSSVATSVSSCRTSDSTTFASFSSCGTAREEFYDSSNGDGAHDGGGDNDDYDDDDDDDDILSFATPNSSPPCSPVIVHHNAAFHNGHERHHLAPPRHAGGVHGHHQQQISEDAKNVNVTLAQARAGLGDLDRHRLRGPAIMASRRDRWDDDPAVHAFTPASGSPRRPPRTVLPIAVRDGDAGRASPPPAAAVPRPRPRRRANSNPVRPTAIFVVRDDPAPPLTDAQLALLDAIRRGAHLVDAGRETAAAAADPDAGFSFASRDRPLGHLEGSTAVGSVSSEPRTSRLPSLDTAAAAAAAAAATAEATCRSSPVPSFISHSRFMGVVRRSRASLPPPSRLPPPSGPPPPPPFPMPPTSSKPDAPAVPPAIASPTTATTPARLSSSVKPKAQPGPPEPQTPNPLEACCDEAMKKLGVDIVYLLQVEQLVTPTSSPTSTSAKRVSQPVSPESIHHFPYKTSTGTPLRMTLLASKGLPQVVQSPSSPPPPEPRSLPSSPIASPKLNNKQPLSPSAANANAIPPQPPSSAAPYPETFADAAKSATQVRFVPSIHLHAVINQGALYRNPACFPSLAKKLRKAKAKKEKAKHNSVSAASLAGGGGEPEGSPRWSSSHLSSPSSVSVATTTTTTTTTTAFGGRGGGGRSAVVGGGEWAGGMKPIASGILLPALEFETARGMSVSVLLVALTRDENHRYSAVDVNIANSLVEQALWLAGELLPSSSSSSSGSSAASSLSSSPTELTAVSSTSSPSRPSDNLLALDAGPLGKGPR